jgi:hypothetical protein
MSIETGDIRPLRTGRSIEMRAMGMVLSPQLILQAWHAGEFGALGYAAEYMANGITADLQQTDPALYGNLSRGLAEARRQGWCGRLDARRLHYLEEVLQATLANQAVEGIMLSTDEVAHVRRKLAAQYLGTRGFKHVGRSASEPKERRE